MTASSPQVVQRACCIMGGSTTIEPKGNQMQLTVSGKAWAEACDPAWRGTPREEGWPEPTMRRRGKGVQYVYDVDVAMAKLIVEQLRIIGESLIWGDDPEVKADARACLAAAVSGEAQIEAATR